MSDCFLKARHAVVHAVIRAVHELIRGGDNDHRPENICLIATRNDILQKLKNFLDAYETDTADKMNRNMVYTALGDLKKILKG